MFVLVASNRHLEKEIEALREENAMLRRMLFGKKSEKLIYETIAWRKRKNKRRKRQNYRLQNKQKHTVQHSRKGNAVSLLL